MEKIVTYNKDWLENLQSLSLGIAMASSMNKNLSSTSLSKKWIESINNDVESTKNSVKQNLIKECKYDLYISIKNEIENNIKDIKSFNVPDFLSNQFSFLSESYNSFNETFRVNHF